MSCLVPKCGIFIPNLVKNLAHLVLGIQPKDILEILHSGRILYANKVDNSE